MAIITDIDLKNNIAEYLQAAENGEEFVVTKNGRQIVKIAPAHEVLEETPRKNFDEIMKSLTGILKGDEDYKNAKDEYLKNKYGIDGENSITASLVGIIKNDGNNENAKDEYLRGKYGIAY